ncbi:hypothetical protein QTP70_004294 [Hemibagrus guttatus]|uniref:Peptidase S1 domain-containing protein n=1 Tax=Hemibagrus guttatus TaxID=175788 RepID=A0AAE0QFH7_9TELE|nr:hypothetical protein QTP70_004294 [Hemibagrus guttatus]
MEVFVNPGLDRSVCGQAPSNYKIVGGEDAVHGSWPWQVRLEFKKGLCGGSLINENWVLSAAHCFPSDTQINTSEITVKLVMESLVGPNLDMQQMNVSDVFVYKAYDPVNNENDIALVKLSSSVTFTNFIRPVCLAGEKDSLPNDIYVWVTGWGRTNHSSDQLAEKLQEVQVRIISNSDCASMYGLLSITDKMICAGFTEGEKDSCTGDSGGPLVFKHNETWVQAGIVSFGYGCALPNYPGVYTRVSQYQDWINSYITIKQPGFIAVSNGNRGAPDIFCLFLSFSIILYLCSLSIS